MMTIRLVAIAMMVCTQPLFAAKTTQQVWDHHIKAWSDRDVDAIVSDYGNESVVVMNSMVYRGPKEIRALFGNLFKVFDRASEHEIDPAIVTGKLVYITWRAKIDEVSYPMGTDTFLIDDGKIEYQTITSNPKLF
jgi:ketosteroid isomerase-like protein